MAGVKLRLTSSCRRIFTTAHTCSIPHLLRHYVTQCWVLDEVARGIVAAQKMEYVMPIRAATSSEPQVVRR